MAVKELWLARHGESVGNVAASQAEVDGLDVIPLDVRDADVPLSGTGREQALALGEWVSAHREAIDAYWVSPYVRARETLAIALGSDGPDATIVVDERIRDRELGVLDLLTRRGVARLHPEETARRQHLGKFYHRPPGGESWADVALRLRSFLRDALNGPEERAMLVVHDAVVMLVLYVLLPMGEEELLDFAKDHVVLNASVTHLTRGEGGWQITAFSDVEHLRREGADVTAHPGSPDVEPR
ncbi:histidine phosphatase family protein [Microbacterium kyungheense]|uniref:Broad specificity phosphatase PhoE n=1 Tax=Microbacterium kyungheense TaxID=1263636 RepID=A0A543FKC1_9MICO|nr:histidine phosphatase family protein [Microbacterium kyungheense]TQM34323.1 broad specificity phosphatase PhoE [Microbacterium kyungheense]